MARYGCTITVAAGKAPSSQPDVAWVATEDNFPTAAIDGGSTSILNGGGNLRCYTGPDKLTQIPIQVVTFVTGVTPSVIVWGLSPTIDVGSTVYIEADTVATAQPAAASTYGSEAVWSPYLMSLQLNEAANNTSGGYYDSTGNGYDGTGVSMSASSVSNPYGDDSAVLSGEPDEIVIPISGLSDELTIEFWANPDSLSQDQRAFSVYKDGAASNPDRLTVIWVDSGGTGDGWAALSRSTGGSAVSIGENSSNATAGAWQRVALYVSNSSFSTYVNGVLADSGTPSSPVSLSVATSIALGRLWTNSGATSYFNGALSGLTVAESDLRGSLLTKSNNQSDPSTFWTTSAWEDQDSSIEITLSESGPSFTESISATISASITAAITESGPSFTESISAEVSSLAISASISEQGPSFTESVEVDIQESTVLAASITESGPSFTESIEVSILKTIESEIAEQGPSFTESITVTIPVTVAGNYKYITRVKNTHSSVRIRNKTNIKRVK